MEALGSLFPGEKIFYALGQHKACSLTARSCTLLVVSPDPQSKKVVVVIAKES